MAIFGTLALPLVKERIKEEARLVEAWLASCLDAPGVPEGLKTAMYYSLLAGGKRIRPVLCLLSARLHGLDPVLALPFAGAVECIHSYSLIHDDLPAMDNDDLRRGKPSNHKQFGEATAILAGDALLTDAFSLMCTAKGLAPERILAAVAAVAEAAGSQGMAGGQFLDMEYTACAGVSLEQLATMHGMKTGAMLRLPCMLGALLAGADAIALAAMHQYGTALGAAFQIMDDILDVTGSEAELGKPVGSDTANKKITYPALLGLEKSRLLAHNKATEAAKALENRQNADVLKGLAGYIVSRVS